MDIFLLILRLGLAGVFGVAGIAKVFDPEGAEKAFGDFGLPRWAARPMTVLLPAAELAIALSILFVTSAWYAAIGAAALLGVFTVGMLIQMAKGKAPDCHCFGQLHSEPVGVGSVVRNLVILAAAVFLVTRGAAAQGLPVVSSQQDVTILVVGIAAAVLLLAIVIYLKKISEQQLQIMRRVEMIELVAQEGGVKRDEAGHPQDGLPIGGIVAEFAGKDLTGATVTLSDLRAEGKPVLFFYVSTSCAPCKALIPDLEAWQKEFKDTVEVVLISSGDAKENLSKFGESLAPAIILQQHKEISDVLHVRWTPSAMLMHSGGRVASHVAAGDLAIQDLIQNVRAMIAGDAAGPYTNNENARVKVGQMVPDLDIADIKGNPLKADQLRGKKTLVTFWSTTCPHCMNMLPQIQEWETSKAADSPNMVIFSDGDVETLQEYGLTSSSIVLDPGHKTANAFGMFGTPSAVLIDENGLFISETAVGAENIWSLIGRRNTNGNGNGHRH